tara:strand:+ start:171 stop:713 length:543 start_codon:yes stop_codon:yes gene_type:complete
MIFQNREFYETDKFQYLPIHKNGSCSVIESIKHLDPKVTDEVNLNKIRWTVIRDPYARFVSGVKYDLKLHNLETKDIDYSSLHNFRINLLTRKNGHVNHSASQIPYIMNTNIDWYVELKDLSTFLKMHFDKTERLNVSEDRGDMGIEKEEVVKYLEVDYYVYREILNSPHLWKWQNGKIF